MKYDLDRTDMIKINGKNCMHWNVAPEALPGSVSIVRIWTAGLTTVSLATIFKVLSIVNCYVYPRYYKLQVPWYIHLYFTRFFTRECNIKPCFTRPWYLGHNTSMTLWEFTIGAIRAILLIIELVGSISRDGLGLPYMYYITKTKISQFR